MEVCCVYEAASTKSNNRVEFIRNKVNLGDTLRFGCSERSSVDSRYRLRQGNETKSEKGKDDRQFDS